MAARGAYCALDFVGQRTPVGITQDYTIGAAGHRGFKGCQGIAWIALETIKKVLRILKNRLLRRLFQIGNRAFNHFKVSFSCDAQRLLDM